MVLNIYSSKIQLEGVACNVRDEGTFKDIE